MDGELTYPYLKVYFSLSLFKKDFESNYLEFTETFKDASINDFIFEYKRQSQIWLDNVTYIYTPEIGYVIKAELLGENIFNEIEKLSKNENGEIDEVKRMNLQFTFNGIISFLNEKETAIEAAKKTDLTPLIDLSDTKGTEKIIYLHQLGILEYLRNFEPFVNSTNSLATVISGITGIPVQTAQSYLNPIYSQSTAQKNNPLKNQKKIESIKQSLINLGFKPQK